MGDVIEREEGLEAFLLEDTSYLLFVLIVCMNRVPRRAELAAVPCYRCVHDCRCDHLHVTTLLELGAIPGLKSDGSQIEGVLDATRFKAICEVGNHKT